MAKSPTATSTRKLSDVARHVRAPKGIVATGWPAVEKKAGELGVKFRWWQKPIGKLLLAKRADGKYAATIGGTGLSIPRQVGKTFLIGAIVFALCLLRPNLTVIWTAHRLRTAEETFKKMQAFAGRSRVKRHIAKIVLGSGDEEIVFRNGSRILFGARERGFGRGFDEVDVVIYDEGQILTEAALDDMIPAMNQCRQETGALLIFMGTPPKPNDPGEVFTRVRDAALAKDDDTGWVEFGAEPGFEPTPSPDDLTDDDWEQVGRANPSYPDDTPREAILRMRKILGNESFLREGLGIWDEKPEHAAVIDLLAWDDLTIPDLDIPEDVPQRYGLTMSPERIASIAVGIPVDDTTTFVDTAEIGRVDDTTQLVDWLVERCGRRYVVMIDSRDPAAALGPSLKARGVRVNSMTVTDSARAWSLLDTAINEGRIQHIKQPVIREGFQIAVRKDIRGKPGMWEVDMADLAPQVAVARAIANVHFGLSFKRRPGRRNNGRRRAAVLS